MCVGVCVRVCVCVGGRGIINKKIYIYVCDYICIMITMTQLDEQ